MIKKILLGLAVAALAVAGSAVAQQSAIKRTPLQKIEFPEGYVTTTVMIEVQPGGSAGRHTHPGIETADLIIEGKTQHLKAGDSYLIPAGTVHDVKVSGDKPAKVFGIYVVDKTKPLASPAS